jgi:hypothetical protein
LKQGEVVARVGVDDAGARVALGRSAEADQRGVVAGLRYADRAGARLEHPVAVVDHRVVGVAGQEQRLPRHPGPDVLEDDVALGVEPVSPVAVALVVAVEQRDR